jgi:hypothetical protein
MKTKKVLLPLMLVLIVVFLASCAPGNERFDADPPGFFYGLWHGFISLVTFIVSLFNESVDIYQVNNGGKMYDFGFILGAAIFYGGGIFGSRRKKC